MVCIVIGARKFGVNPDNIATPIAASLGDLITLSFLAFISSFFYKHKGRGYPRKRGPPTRLIKNVFTHPATFKSGTIPSRRNLWVLLWSQKSFFYRGKA